MPLPTSPCADPVDLCLESPRGAPFALRSLRGRVVVLFVESRERLADNAPLKEALRAARHAFSAGAPPERAPLALVGVGDVRAFSATAMRPVVRAAIRALSERVGETLALDWEGAAYGPPLACDPRTSNVVVLDPDGRIALRHSGPVPAAAVRGFVDSIVALVPAARPTPSIAAASPGI